MKQAQADDNTPELRTRAIQEGQALLLLILLLILPPQISDMHMNATRERKDKERPGQDGGALLTCT